MCDPFVYAKHALDDTIRWRYNKLIGILINSVWNAVKHHEQSKRYKINSEYDTTSGVVEISQSLIENSENDSYV